MPTFSGYSGHIATWKQLVAIDQHIQNCSVLGTRARWLWKGALKPFWLTASREFAARQLFIAFYQKLRLPHLIEHRLAGAIKWRRLAEHLALIL